MFRELLKIMLEHRAGPVRVLEETLCPRGNEVADYQENNSNNYSDSNKYQETKSKKTCPECHGTGEDESRYDTFLGMGPACSGCHGSGEVD